MYKTVNRRSYVVVDSLLYSSSSNIVKYRSLADLSDSRDGAGGSDFRTINALSLESTVVWERGRISSSVSLNRLQLRDQPAPEIIEEILGELVGSVVDRVEKERRDQVVENILSRYIPVPILRRGEVSQVSSNLSSAFYSMQESTSRLHAAWRIILVSAAQQLQLSYKRVVMIKNCELARELELLGLEQRSILTDPQGLLLLLLKDRENILRRNQSETSKPSDIRRSETSPSLLAPEQRFETNPALIVPEQGSETSPPLLAPDQGSQTLSLVPEHVLETSLSVVQDQSSLSDDIVRRYSEETLLELRQVTDRILDLSVVYLKNATRSVVENSVENIKTILSEPTESSRL